MCSTYIAKQDKREIFQSVKPFSAQWKSNLKYLGILKSHTMHAEILGNIKIPYHACWKERKSMNEVFPKKKKTSSIQTLLKPWITGHSSF